MSPLRFVHVGRKCLEIHRLRTWRAGSRARNTDKGSAMFQQKATCDYQDRFHVSKLICEHENLSLPGPGQMFQALEVPPPN